MKRNIGLLVVACCTFFIFGTTTAGMYKWVDENGVVHFSDSPVATDKNDTNYEELEGVQNTGNTFLFSKEWFDNDNGEAAKRSEQAASALLERQENWPVKPFFYQEHDLYVGQYTESIVLKAKIPEAAKAYSPAGDNIVALSRTVSLDLILLV
jgi:hypothetical protein